MGLRFNKNGFLIPNYANSDVLGSKARDQPIRRGQGSAANELSTKGRLFDGISRYFHSASHRMENICTTIFTLTSDLAVFDFDVRRRSFLIVTVAFIF